MRKIKFRAWDAHTKTMYEDASTHKDNSDDVRPWIYMQFTGLYDKNGKEIYEGDIVNFDYSDEQNGYSGNQVVRFVEFEAGFYPFCLRSRWRASIDNIEVIGNIYENGDLLNGK